MTIRFFLIDNPLTPDPEDCRAQVVTNGTKTMDDAIEAALKRGTLVTKTDLKAVTELLFDVLSDFVAEGNTIITPLCKVRPTIKGVFKDDQASFDPLVHEVKPSIVAGAQLAEKMSKCSMVKIKASKNDPELNRLSDNRSGKSNSEITPGGMALLIGDSLLFDEIDPDQGLFFISSTGTETKVTEIQEAVAKKVSFLVPSGLTQGSYKLMMRTRIYSQKMRHGDLTDLQVK